MESLFSLRCYFWVKNNFPYSCAENCSGSTLVIPMVNFTFNSAVVSVKSQQVWGLGFSYSAFKENHFSCKSSNNSQSILFRFISSWSLFIRWDPSVTEKWMNFKCDFCGVQFLTCFQCSTCDDICKFQSLTLFSWDHATQPHIYIRLTCVCMWKSIPVRDSKINFSTFQHMHTIIPHHLVCCNSV